MTAGCTAGRVGVVGRIVAGDELAKFVRVDVLPGEPPSYLVLLAYDPEFRRGCGDFWVEDLASVGQFFAEGEWAVEWLSSGSFKEL